MSRDLDVTRGIDGVGRPPQSAVSAREWLGQPRGLTILFLTDMWEQFSYYGMRALLVYYMVKQLQMAQQQASLVYGAYTAFAFFTPLLGGLIADRYLGRHRAVLLGGSIMALGHFMMAFEGSFYLALATIGIGNGLFLPNLPAQIDGLYAVDDPRRKSAYNYYYVGANAGAFLAPFACGTVGEIYGWHWGFTVAGVGMVAGLVIYTLGGRYLPGTSSAVRGSPIGLLVVRNSPHRRETLRRLGLLAGIALCAVVFRAAYEQLGNTVVLWTESANRSVGRWVIPMTWFSALNPLLVMALSPWLAAMWTRRARQGSEPTSIAKMSFGATVICLSYLALSGVALWTTRHGGSASWLWLLAFFVVMTIGEMYVLPIGLGLFGRLAPQGLRGTAIALWYFAAFAGNLLAGVVGTLWAPFSPGGFFALTAAIAGLAALLLRLFNRPATLADR